MSMIEDFLDCPYCKNEFHWYYTTPENINHVKLLTVYQIPVDAVSAFRDHNGAKLQVRCKHCNKIIDLDEEDYIGS